LQSKREERREKREERKERREKREERRDKREERREKISHPSVTRDVTPYHGCYARRNTLPWVLRET